MKCANCKVPIHEGTDDNGKSVWRHRMTDSMYCEMLATPESAATAPVGTYHCPICDKDFPHLHPASEVRWHRDALSDLSKKLSFFCQGIAEYRHVSYKLILRWVAVVAETLIREEEGEDNAAAAAPVPQLSVDVMAAKMAEHDENWTVSYGRGTKLWTIVIPWHDIKVHSKKLSEAFELAEAALKQAREEGVK